MGLFKGALSYRRFRLQGDLPADHRNQFLAAVQKHAFRPLEDDPEAERSAGWVSIHDPLDAEWTGEKLYFDEQMLLALRIDHKRVPARVLAAYLQKAEREYVQKNRRQGLTRQERRNLRDLVRTQLLARVLPSLATYDVAVDLTEREVRFWSLTRSVCDTFLELFEATFGLGLLPLGAYGLASKLLAPADLDRLDLVAPSAFVRPGRRSGAKP
jgi:DNA recombination-dependent growth factor C